MVLVASAKAFLNGSAGVSGGLVIIRLVSSGGGGGGFSPPFCGGGAGGGWGFPRPFPGGVRGAHAPYTFTSSPCLLPIPAVLRQSSAGRIRRRSGAPAHHTCSGRTAGTHSPRC